MTGEASVAGGGLAEADLRRLIDVFRETGRRSLDLRVGETRLKLGAPGAVAAEVAAPAGPAVSVASPGVGHFQAAQDWAPGAQVSADTVLGRVRSVWKVKNVVAGTAGAISRQIVRDGAFVEYGETIFEIAGGAA